VQEVPDLVAQHAAGSVSIITAACKPLIEKRTSSGRLRLPAAVARVVEPLARSCARMQTLHRP
jgi:hypothetical protein